jgi:hypothetical protein
MITLDPGSDMEGYSVLCYSLTGDLLQSTRNLRGKGTIDISRLEPGIYLLEIKSLSGFSNYQKLFRE